MSIWFVVTVLGNIAATVGPLPYDIAECQARLPEQAAEIDRGFAAGSPILVDGHPVRRADIKLDCVRAKSRPANAPSQ